MWTVVLRWLGGDAVDGAVVDGVPVADPAIQLLVHLKERLCCFINPYLFYFFWLLVCWRVGLSRNKVIFK